MNHRAIYISAISATCNDYSNLDGLFDALLAPPESPATSAPIAPPPWHNCATEWASHTHRAIHQLTDGRTVLPPDCGFILGSTKGDIARQLLWMHEPQPSARPRPTLDQDAAALARHAGVGGPAYCISTACTSGLSALIEAAELIKTLAAPECIAMGADVISDFVCDGFKALRALSHSVCRPFDRHRDGLTLGSAAAATLLCTKPSPGAVLLSGWGAAGDAAHLTAPDRAGRGLTLAIERALAMAGLRPEHIDLIFAHGTGTPFNDAMEATAFASLFPNRPCITAIKGLTGHTLGAAGVLETAVACRILQTGVVPPVTGLENPDFPDLNFVVGRPQTSHPRRILKTGSGFGGLNTALILELPPQEPYR
ncbi:MAG: beta-ketoacyl-[acyl-carrier-protein] synthase family protein [Phycisphaerales bacterium]|nr:beta-ketoacyl-[acyl-carrier-protein] synthase family protein [Phycisphaerales bacterium]